MRLDRLEVDRIKFSHRGRVAIIEKRVVHQWRTDILLTLAGRTREWLDRQRRADRD